MYPYIKNTVITDLGFGGGFALWGFRAIAGRQSQNCQFSAGFNRAFSMDNNTVKSQHGGTNGRIAINALKSFSYQLRCTGKRKILLASSGSMRMTADEICVVAALSAAQCGEADRCRAHLTWLLASDAIDLAYHAAVTYGMVCRHSCIEIERPTQVLIDKALDVPSMLGQHNFGIKAGLTARL